MTEVFGIRSDEFTSARASNGHIPLDGATLEGPSGAVEIHIVGEAIFITVELATGHREISLQRQAAAIHTNILIRSAESHASGAHLAEIQIG